jgi:beta-glucosidase
MSEASEELVVAFPPPFTFGVSTSAYQIEGAVDRDGRAPSIWDRFSHTPGKIRDGSNGDVAVGHYDRWQQDLDLLVQLGVDAYRFSIAWPRVVPDGAGAVNRAGLDFYERLVDGLLARGIEPYVTLYHWDLPLALHDRGGWLKRDTAHHFARYAEIVARTLGDRVRHFATLNEPRCAAMVGFLEGRHAPGERSLPHALTAAHHMLLAHGLAVPAIRASASGTTPALRGASMSGSTPALRGGVVTREPSVSVVLDVKPIVPASAAEPDRRAAHALDGVFNRLYLDAILRGAYPEDVWAGFGPAVPVVAPDDLATIAAPLDALGLNYYTRAVVRHEPATQYPSAVEVPVPGATYTTMNTEVFPEGLRDMLVRLHADYALPPVYIAENGAAFTDTVSAGRVADSARQAYLEQHLAALSEARAAGVVVNGYFVWSFLDNFEWGHGYLQRFGIVHVDFQTLERTLKDSAHWLRTLLHARRDRITS